MLLTIAAAVAAVCVVGGTVVLYNRLVKLRNNADNGWAQIDVQLQRRADLVPNLVNTVKGYATHERETLEAVTLARTALTDAATPGEAAAADNMLTGALRQLFALSQGVSHLVFKIEWEQDDGSACRTRRI